jgi:hypothetical protein
MFAEARMLRLSDRQSVRTPLLVPSFSSKGFGRVGDSPVRSELSEVLEYFANQLPDSYLVSAYDLHAGLLAAGDGWGDVAWADSPLSQTAALFLDSGGYEIRVGTDAGEVVQDLSPQLVDWDEAIYGEFLDRLPSAAQNVVAVSWDYRETTYGDQIKAAQEFFTGRQAASVILLKPPTGRHHRFAGLEPAAERLAAFDAVGVTEHELGTSLIDRIEATIELREILTRAHLDLPIHIFGALDPLYVPIYFAAGADIFDGLTWLRYSYWGGLTGHREHGPLLDGELEAREDVRRLVVLTRNLGFLAQLKTKLQRLAQDGDWNVFSNDQIRTKDGRLGDSLREAYLSASARRG